MSQRKVIRTTVGELIVAVMDEIIPRVNDPLVVYAMTSRVINDLLARRQLRLSNRSRRRRRKSDCN